MVRGDKLSVVVPSSREGEGLLRCLETLSGTPGVSEVIVAAHAESETVRRRALQIGAIAWTACPKASRGEQLNRGAVAARGEILLFLHADTVIPTAAAAAIEGALADPEVVGGGFRLAFDARHPALQLLESLSWLSWPTAFFGDQALFCRRHDFQAVGGFPEEPLFEDVGLMLRLARRGRLARLQEPVTTSARRFRASGPWRQLGRNARLLALFHLGVAPQRLARMYGPQPGVNGTEKAAVHEAMNRAHRPASTPFPAPPRRAPRDGSRRLGPS